MKEWGLIGLAGGVASLGGLAFKLKGGGKVTVMEVLRAVLTSFAVGIICALLSFPLVVKAPEYLYTWLGLCGLGGYGGASILDFLLAVVKRRVRIRLQDTPVEGEGKDVE